MSTKTMTRAALAAVAVAALGATAANAQITPASGVTFSGTTTGLFGAGAGSATSSIPGLSFTGGAFSAVTDDAGQISFAGGTLLPSANINNQSTQGGAFVAGVQQAPLGTFTLTNTATPFIGTEQFRLLVNFTSPAAPQTTFQATLFGVITATDDSTVSLGFNQIVPAPGPINFSTATTSGFFLFNVNNVTVTTDAPGTSNLAGTITAFTNPIPEFSTVASMGGLLAGGGLMAFRGSVRRRRNSAAVA